MSEVTQQQVVDFIKGISVLELSQLVKTLESELGVSAAAAMPMAVAGGGGAAAAAPAEEKTEFTVTLTDIGGNKINVIKVVREITSLGWAPMAASRASLRRNSRVTRREASRGSRRGCSM